MKLIKMERRGAAQLPRIFTENEKKRWFRKPLIVKREFQAIATIVSGFYTWIEIPDARLVSDSLSFQLDAYVQNIQEGMQP